MAAVFLVPLVQISCETSPSDLCWLLGLFCVPAKHLCSIPVVCLIEGNTAGGSNLCCLQLGFAMSPGAIIVSRCLSTKLVYNSELPDTLNENPFLFASPAWSRKLSGVCAYFLAEIYSFHTSPSLFLVVRRKAPRIKTQSPVFSAFHLVPYVFNQRFHFPFFFVGCRLRHCLFKSEGKRKENDHSQFLLLRGKRTFPNYIVRFV